MSETNERSVASDVSVAGDIVDRLRRTVAGSPRWHRNPDGPEAADEIERLREAICRLAEQDATLSVCDGNVTVTMDATLTDAEREAVAWAEDCADSQREWKIGATLRGLRERTK